MFIIFHHCSVQMMFIITPPIVHPPFHVKNHHFCCKTRWMLVAEVGEVESCAHGSWGPKKTQPLPKSSRLELFFYVCVKMVNRQNPQFDGIFVHFHFSKLMVPWNFDEYWVPYFQTNTFFHIGCSSNVDQQLRNRCEHPVIQSDKDAISPAFAPTSLNGTGLVRKSHSTFQSLKRSPTNNIKQQAKP